jgi:Kef-type K+ transport system membrane component KefB
MSGHGPRPRAADVGLAVLGISAAVAAITLLDRLGVFTTRPGPLYALGLLSLAGLVGGQAAALVGLPRLTGYLLAGVLAGPQLGGLVGKDDVKALGLVNALALALIALQAGAEVTLPVLARIARSLAFAALTQVTIVVGGSALVFALLADFIPFLDGLSPSAIAAVAALWGVFAFTRSPSVTLAVLAETRAKGPMTEWALGLVVVLDVLVLPVFTAALTLARAELDGQPFEPRVFLELSHELWASVLAGIAGGVALGLLLKLRRLHGVLLVVVSSYAVTALSTYLRWDTLFVFVVIGFVASNVIGSGPRVLAAAETTSGAVFVVFFALAGAKLDLGALTSTWPVALALVAARTVTTFVACRIGHRLARDPEAVRKNGWLALISQAGVTIGLASIAGDLLPGIGRPLASLVIAVVGIHELIGPITLRLGLQRAGELPGGDGDGDGGAHDPSAARDDHAHA